jgi:hypothetical protein
MDNSVLASPHFVYPLFGLHIHSNLALSQISSVQINLADSIEAIILESRGRTVQVSLQVSPSEPWLSRGVSEELSYTSDYKDTQGDPALRIWKVNGGELLRLAYFDGTQFWLDRDGTRVWATWPDNLSLEDTASYLLGPVLGLLLRLRGVVCLHASAVSFGESVVAFVGSEGAGKSTTAAAFAQQGWGTVSDDVVALNETDGAFHVHPAYPYICLWPESAEAIFGNAQALPRFSGNYAKRYLSLEKHKMRFETRTLPLKAIYMLGERRADPAPQIETISGQKSILALVANTFATNVINSDMRVKEFEALGRLISCARIQRIFAHKDPRRLPDLCRLIRKDLESINVGVSGSPNLRVSGQ